MRLIAKRQREPETLLQHRKSSPDPLPWNSLSKEQLDLIRSCLLEDQRNICCYCMRRIGIDSMKVEHYRPQSQHPGDALAWKNLLAACFGNEGKPRPQQTCDTRKQNARLSVDPLREMTLKDMRYLSDGSIKSADAEIDADLNERLNLNFEQLRQNRASATDGLIRGLRKKYGAAGSWTKAHLESELAQLRKETPYRPFISVLEALLLKLVRRKQQAHTP
jgi:uncharacterized protein (TIGR02646 family)